MGPLEPVFAVGALVYLFLLMLAASLPGKTALDKVLIWLALAVFFWHAGNLLAVVMAANPRVYSGAGIVLGRTIALAGWTASAPLLLHLHRAYGGRLSSGWLYVPLLAAPWVIWTSAQHPAYPVTLGMRVWAVYLAGALGLAARWHGRWRAGAREDLRRLHHGCAVTFGMLAGGCLYAVALAPALPGSDTGRALLIAGSILPGAFAGYYMLRHDFWRGAQQANVVVGAIWLSGLLSYCLLVSTLARYLDQRGLVPYLVTAVLLTFALLPAVDGLRQRFVGWFTGQVAGDIVRLEALHSELRAAALAQPPERCRVFTADRISAFLGFPVTVSESGELRAEAGRPLRFRENSLLRALALHTAETMQTAHLLADRLRLERELAEKEKLASLGEMAAFVAHRLKNPLSAINALVQVIAERSPEAAGHCQVIRGEIARLDTSVRDLLRFTAPPAPLSPAVTPARAAAEEAAALFSAEAARKGVRVEVQAEAADLPMAAGALHDVLVALLGNALDAAPAGSAIHLTWRPPILSVEDQGPGVLPVHGRRIFDPFFTQKSGGTGLGLAIARRRCQEAGAEIRCISPANDGRGARFEIVFPHR